MNLLEIRTCDKPIRYYINGKRVSKADFEYQEILANIQGKQKHSLFTKAIEIGQGKFRRYNYSSIN